MDSLNMPFTGIVEEMGRVVSIDMSDSHCDIIIEATVVLEGTELGHSISVNGTCLTVTEMSGNTFKVGLVQETLRRTNLGRLTEGSKVNLERAMTPTSRMGGHNVQGHVDGTGTIKSRRADGDSLRYEIEASEEVMRYVVEKGYIAVDGTSLTVCEPTDTTFAFYMVPFTQKHVIITDKGEGDMVNLEVDIQGKLIEKYVEKYAARILAGAAK